MFDFSSIALPVVFSITSHFACVRLVSNPLSFCISFYFLHYLGDSGNTVISVLCGYFITVLYGEFCGYNTVP